MQRRTRLFLSVTVFPVSFLVCASMFCGVSVFAQEDVTTSNPESEMVSVEETSVVEGESDNGVSLDYDEVIANVGEYSVTPVVENEKAKPRDIIKKELLVTNNTAERIDLYIRVENIDPSQGAQSFESPTTLDLSVSLANWVEITRGVIELGPGESRKIPYLIHVNLTAKPGSYYARILFQKGTRRADAEASKDGVALMLNVEVEDDANERLQLGNFLAEDGVVFGNNVSFSYLLENVGNRIIEPRGSIRIFNRRGEEVGSIPLNAEGQEITPENKSQLAAVWSASGRFGKYKAFLDLEYGENQLASVQDTVYFWVFPWKEIIMSLSGIAVLAIVGTYIVHMRATAQPSYVKKSNASYAPSAYSMTENHFATLKNNSTMYNKKEHTTAFEQSTVLAQVSSLKQRIPRHIPIVEKTPRQVSFGATIELTSRSQRKNATIHGDVVQLSSRH